MTLRFQDVADEVEVVFNQHYRRTAVEPDAWEQSAYSHGIRSWIRDGSPAAVAIEELCGIAASVAEELREILADRHYDFEAAKMHEESEFDSDVHYEEKGVDDRELRAEWREFESSLRTKSRYFNDAARKTLDLIFADVENSSTGDGEKAIRTAGPGTELAAVYRARVFQSEGALQKALERPDRELSAPPSNLASAGRMNARGVSVFYGASNADVALSEVRPPVGSRVLLGRFDFARPVRLLDVRSLERLSTKGSLFDRSFADRLRRAMFLRHLATLISRPIMPSDEAMDYLATQAMADYLAARTDLRIDGIIFRSAQSEGTGFNLCLFNQASKTEEWSIPAGTEIEAHMHYDHGEEGDEPTPEGYIVLEQTPPQESPKQVVQVNPFAGSFLYPVVDLDERIPALRLSPDEMKVLHVKGVSFSRATFEVSRDRSELAAKLPEFKLEADDIDF